MEKEFKNPKQDTNQSYQVVDDKELTRKFGKSFSDCSLYKEENIEKVIEETYKNIGGDFLWDPETFREFDKKRNKNYQPLEVLVSIKIYSVDFPDSNRDELRLNVIFFTGAKKADLIQTIEKGILPQQKEKLKEKLDEMKSLLETDEGCDVLDDVQRGWLSKWLHVKIFEECSEPKIVSDYFCLALDKSYVYQNRQCIVRIKAPLNIKDYPFDTNELNFLLISAYGKATDEVNLIPDREDMYDDISIGEGFEPRGLRIKILPKGDKSRCKAFVLDEGPDITESPVLQFGFHLERNAWAVILRTILPAIVIMLAGIVFAIWSLLTQGRADSVAIHVIPGVLIAIVALQITAAQGIPSHSSATLLDIFFILMYMHVLFLLLALIANFGVVITWGLFAVSIGFLLTGIWLVIHKWIFHTSDKNDLKKAKPAVAH
jgi:hypothetical protein